MRGARSARRLRGVSTKLGNAEVRSIRSIFNSVASVSFGGAEVLVARIHVGPRRLCLSKQQGSRFKLQKWRLAGGREDESRCGPGQEVGEEPTLGAEAKIEEVTTSSPT